MLNRTRIVALGACLAAVACAPNVGSTDEKSIGATTSALKTLHPQTDNQGGDDTHVESATNTPRARVAIPAPHTTFSAAEQKRFAGPCERADAVPVLLFHGICATVCPPANVYGVTQVEFARMMSMLKAVGYSTISTAEYVSFRRDKGTQLPPHPILLTFDDGRLDSWTGADDVLLTAHFRATMFAQVC